MSSYSLRTVKTVPVVSWPVPPINHPSSSLCFPDLNTVQKKAIQEGHKCQFKSVKPCSATWSRHLLAIF